MQKMALFSQTYLTKSPTHFLADVLYKGLTNNINLPKSCVNNSFELIKKLNNLVIPDDFALMSLDVK